MNGWVDGWMNGLVDGWMDGCMHVRSVKQKAGSDGRRNELTSLPATLSGSANVVTKANPSFVLSTADNSRLGEIFLLSPRPHGPSPVSDCQRKLHLLQNCSKGVQTLTVIIMDAYAKFRLSLGQLFVGLLSLENESKDCCSRYIYRALSSCLPFVFPRFMIIVESLSLSVLACLCEII